MGQAMRRSAILVLLSVMVAPTAQGAPPSDPNTSAGEVGQRQSREQAAPSLRPLERVASRITNRIQSRVHTRLDRYYDPQGNAQSPFKVAGEQARVAGRAVRR